MSRLVSHTRLTAGAILVAVLMLLALLPPGISAQPAAPATPVVARVYYSDKADLNGMGATLDVWTVVAKEGYAVILLQPEEYSRLTASGHPIEIDAALTTHVNAPQSDSLSADAGIPSYPCYRTSRKPTTAWRCLPPTTRDS